MSLTIREWPLISAKTKIFQGVHPLHLKVFLKESYYPNGSSCSSWACLGVAKREEVLGCRVKSPHLFATSSKPS